MTNVELSASLLDTAQKAAKKCTEDLSGDQTIKTVETAFVEGYLQGAIFINEIYALHRITQHELSQN